MSNKGSGSVKHIMGSMRAADSNRRRAGTSRTPAKLPTSLEEARGALDSLLSGVKSVDSEDDD